MKLTIKSESAYSDGHESERIETVDIEPFEDIEELWEQLHDYTGDGHGTDSSLGYFYAITVLESPDRPTLVGQREEWCGI
ncbi:hypothetical protein [Mycolicibacterium llatzerense]|uniref:hypothetical protein n=1 Tax=Mycolicibacterium llatzerense TaxID=280871 RepID=UPI0021B5A6DE|nr:hypothetical protein [Mycolicibacterium llatzerense]MCT7373279.1 hypothetical protein [Mycolicibacterium llatzerense]